MVGWWVTVGGKGTARASGSVVTTCLCSWCSCENLRSISHPTLQQHWAGPQCEVSPSSGVPCAGCMRCRKRLTLHAAGTGAGLSGARRPRWNPVTAGLRVNWREASTHPWKWKVILKKVVAFRPPARADCPAASGGPTGRPSAGIRPRAWGRHAAARALPATLRGQPAAIETLPQRATRTHPNTGDYWLYPLLGQLAHRYLARGPKLVLRLQ